MPAAEGLVVRVLSSVVKKVEVKQVFRDIFQEETYPSEFPYKSKVESYRTFLLCFCYVIMQVLVMDI